MVKAPPASVGMPQHPKQADAAFSARRLAWAKLQARGTRRPLPHLLKPHDQIARSVLGAAAQGSTAVDKDQQLCRGIAYLPQPVPGVSRPGDLVDVDHFQKWGEPNFVGNLLLETWIGKAARKAGLFWPTLADLRIMDQLLERYGRDLLNEQVVYPKYFCQNFHGYKTNFSALSVAQQASAMAVVPAVMTGGKLDEAFGVRREKLQAAAQVYKAYQGNWQQTSRVVDLGCGTGATTRVLAREYDAEVVGVDLACPMLSWARASTEWPAGVFTAPQLKQICLDDDPRDLVPRLHWQHDNAENTSLAAGQFDLAVLQFTAHELPEEAMRNVAREALRLVRPGGWFAVIDNDQHVKNLHDGPEIMRRLAGMMAREPHLHEYLREDLGVILADNGFINVDDVRAVPGCTLVLGQKPQPRRRHKG